MPSQAIKIVAGIIEDASGHILLAKRQTNQHQGNLWEFPGGKQAADESPEITLKRELWEELGLDIQACEPAIQINHHYSDKHISLNIWWIKSWQHLPFGKEGQQLRWVTANQLKKYSFPAANKAILTAIQLPDSYQISALKPLALPLFLPQLQKQLQQGLQLYQLRLADFKLYPRYFEAVYQLCQQYQCQLMLNSGALKVLNHLPPSVGIHYQAQALAQLQHKPTHLSAASCHDAAQIEQSQQQQIDFICISPVKATSSHPQASALAWQQFWQYSQLANCPIYALGGMTPKNINCARAHGGQGIAGIRMKDTIA